MMEPNLENMVDDEQFKPTIMQCFPVWGACLVTYWGSSILWILWGLPLHGQWLAQVWVQANMPKANPDNIRHDIIVTHACCIKYKRDYVSIKSVNFQSAFIFDTACIIHNDVTSHAVGIYSADGTFTITLAMFHK